jgi:hypothetical protein
MLNTVFWLNLKYYVNCISCTEPDVYNEKNSCACDKVRYVVMWNRDNVFLTLSIKLFKEKVLLYGHFPLYGVYLIYTAFCVLTILPMPDFLTYNYFRYYRVLTMVYNTQKYWVFRLCPSSGFENPGSLCTIILLLFYYDIHISIGLNKTWELFSTRGVHQLLCRHGDGCCLVLEGHMWSSHLACLLMVCCVLWNLLSYWCSFLFYVISTFFSCILWSTAKSVLLF